MYKDDGFTDYSRSYWEASKGPEGSRDLVVYEPYRADGLGLAVLPGGR